MIDVVQWRASIGTWNKCSRSCKISDAKQLSFTDVISTKLLLLLVNAGSSFIIVLSLLLLLLVCGDIETNPGPLLTVGELDLALKELVDWELFGTHLPSITQSDIDKIQREHRSVDDQKLALYKIWLKKYTTASWDDVIESLKKNSENTLASEIETNKDRSSSDSVCSSAKQTSSNKLTVLDKAEKLHEYFEKLLLSLYRILDHSKGNVDALRTFLIMRIASNSKVSSEAKTHSLELEERDSFGKIINYLAASKFIGYLNYDLLKEFRLFTVEGQLEQLIKDYEDHYKEFIRTTDFPTLMAVVREHPNLKLVSPVGLPTFQMILTSNEQQSVYYWNELFEKELPWTQQQVQLVDIISKCIILHFSVIPIAARAVVRDLTDEQILARLKEKGVTIELSDELLLMGRLDADTVAIATIDVISLNDHFQIFVADIEKELVADPSDIAKDIENRFCCYLSMGHLTGITEILQHHVREIEKAATPQRMWRYLVDSHFVQYLNIHLVRAILPKTDNITKIINGYEDHQKKFLDQTDFITLGEIISTHSEYSPGTVSQLPKFLLTLEDPFTSISIFRWNRILLDTFKSSEFFVLTNITKSAESGGINIEYSVLPIGVSNAIKELTDTNVLKYIGGTVVDTSDLNKFEINCEQSSRQRDISMQMAATVIQPGKEKQKFEAKKGIIASEVFNNYIPQLMECFEPYPFRFHYGNYIFDMYDLIDDMYDLIDERQFSFMLFEGLLNLVKKSLQTAKHSPEYIIEKFLDSMRYPLRGIEFGDLRDRMLMEFKSLKQTAIVLGKDPRDNTSQDIAASDVFVKYIPEMLKLFKHLSIGHRYMIRSYDRSFRRMSSVLGHRECGTLFYKTLLECVKERLKVADDQRKFIDRFIEAMERYPGMRNKQELLCILDELKRDISSEDVLLTRSSGQKDLPIIQHTTTISSKDVLTKSQTQIDDKSLVDQQDISRQPATH